MGWFFGFKLHLIINDKGEILNFVFTTGGVDDREPLKVTRNLSMTGNFLYSKIISNSRYLKILDIT